MHGEAQFEFVVLELCPPQDCISCEQDWIDWLEPEFNIALSTKASMAGRRHSEATKAKIRVAIGKRMVGNKFWVGRHHSEATKQKMSDKLRGRRMTEQQRANLSAAMKGNTVNARKTHCDHGHPFDNVNSYRRKDGQRVCRACNKARFKRWRARQ